MMRTKNNKYAMNFNEFIKQIDELDGIAVPKNYIEVNTIYGELESKLRRSKKAK